MISTSHNMVKRTQKFDKNNAVLLEINRTLFKKILMMMNNSFPN